MKRKLSFLLALVLLLGLLAGCGGKAVEIDLSSLSEALLSSGAFTAVIEPVDSEIGCYLYGLETGDACPAAEMVFFLSEGATANELALFKAKDKDSAAVLAKAVTDRLDYQKQSFESYAPAEVSKLEDAIVTTTGLYVLLVVTEDYSAARTTLDTYTKA
jgi:hypothetical protein